MFLNFIYLDSKTQMPDSVIIQMRCFVAFASNIHWVCRNYYEYPHQGLTNPLPSCPGQVQILAGQVIFLFHLPRKMYRIYREYCNSKSFSRCCWILGKWLKLGFVRPCTCFGTNNNCQIIVVVFFFFFCWFDFCNKKHVFCFRDMWTDGL